MIKVTLKNCKMLFNRRVLYYTLPKPIQNRRFHASQLLKQSPFSITEKTYMNLIFLMIFLFKYFQSATDPKNNKLNEKFSFNL